jgi:hypothetical protein
VPESVSWDYLAAPQPAPSGARAWSKILEYLNDAATGLAEGAKNTTLHFGVPVLAETLNKYPDSRYWLRTHRFNDLERRMACWLDPSLDPRWDAVIEGDPELKRKLQKSRSNVRQMKYRSLGT